MSMAGTTVDDRDVDIYPVFAEVTDVLYGGAVDPRELWNVIKMNDSSEMHVPGVNGKLKKIKVNNPKSVNKPNNIENLHAQRNKRQAQVGLATNVVGITSGGVALASAARDPRFAEGGKIAQGIYHGGVKLAEKSPKFLQSPKAGKAGAIAAGGALGLQALNVGGDMIANRVLNREAKKKIPVTKADWAFVHDIVKARQAGTINTDQAIDMAAAITEEVEKAAAFRNAALMGGAMKTALKHKVSSVPKVISTANKPSAITPPKPSLMHPMKRMNMMRKPELSQVPKAMAAAAPKAQQVALGSTFLAGGAAGAGLMHNRMKPKPVGVQKADEADIEWSGEITKMDTDKRQVFGWCSVSKVNGEPVIDLQDDYIPIEEAEKSAYEYVLKSRKGGDQHQRLGEQPLHVSDMIESFVATPEKLQAMGLAEDALPHGWWVGFKVNDDKTWDLVKKGERTGFSVHGKGIRKSITIPTEDES